MKALLLMVCMMMIAGAARAQQPQPNTWIRLAPVGEARQEVGVAELNGRIYFIGGFNRPNGRTGVANTVEAYDPKTDRWQFVAPLPETLHHTTAVSLGGFLYVIGGYNTLSFNPVSSAYRYDPATNTWTAIANLPTRRGALASVVLNGRIYAVGGNATSALGDLASYDPATNNWTQLAPMPTTREHIAAGVINGKIYVVGGRRPGNFTLNTNEEYDPATNSWRTRAPMPTGRSGHAAAVANNRLYVFGGEGNGSNPLGTFPQNESYDPVTDTWRSEVPMPTPRHGIGAATLDGIIYIPGGAPVLGFSVTDINEAFVVAPVRNNRAPVIDPIPNQTLRGNGNEQCINLRVTDPDGDSVTVTCAPDNPSFARCVDGTRVCLTPGPADVGTFQVCALARDSAGNETRSCFNVDVFVNRAPRVERLTDITIFEGETTQVQVSASDDDTTRDPAGDGRVMLVLTEAPPFVRLTDNGSGRGTLTIAPDMGAAGMTQQNFAVTVEARDSGMPPLRAATSFTVTVRAGMRPPATPVISAAQFGSKTLTITATDASANPQIEVNGTVVQPKSLTARVLGNQFTLAATGNKKRLNIRRGANTVVLIVNGVRSAPFSFTF